MAPSPCDNDYQSIGKLCLELCQASVAIGHVVKLSLDIGSSFSFNYSSENSGNSLPAVVEKPKKKSPATLQRDRQRRAAFLLKKAASSEMCPPVAQDHSLPESPEVTTSQVDAILPSSSLEPRSSDTESIVEDNPDSSFTLLANRKDTNNTLCICSSVPCVCLASKPLSPIRDQPAVVPSFKIKKANAGWSTTTSSTHPLCDNCGHPFLNSKHLCVDDDDENDNQNSKCESTRGPEEDILDYKACHDVVANDFFSPHDKHKILERNCISLLKIEPINFELAKYCFTRSKFFHLLKNDHTLGLSMQKLVNIFDKEFEDAYKMHYN